MAVQPIAMPPGSVTLVRAGELLAEQAKNGHLVPSCDQTAICQDLYDIFMRGTFHFRRFEFLE